MTSEGRDELGYRFEQVRNETIVRDLEDRRFAVVVDGNDDLAFLHPGEVLNRTGNADRDVQIGRDNLAGLTNLHFVRHKTGVKSRTP